MFPSEMIILMAIAANKATGKKLLNRSMDVTTEYIGYLYDSLINRGYLKGQKSEGYLLTATGKKAMADFLRKNDTRAKDVIKRLKQLGIDINPEQEHKISKLEKEAVKTG